MKEKEEEEERKKNEVSSQPGSSAVDPKKPPTGKDAKKDAPKGKPAPGKAGQPILEDKNAPKNVEFEYPEVDCSSNFIIVERDYTIHVNKHKTSLSAVKEISAKPSQVAMTAEEKRAQRMKELLVDFKIVRGLPYTMAVNMQLNKPKEVPKLEVEKEEEKPMSQPDPKNKGKAQPPRKK